MHFYMINVLYFNLFGSENCYSRIAAKINGFALNCFALALTLTQQPLIDLIPYAPHYLTSIFALLVDTLL